MLPMVADDFSGFVEAMLDDDEKTRLLEVYKAAWTVSL
jgi:hypothetical protein